MIANGFRRFPIKDTMSVKEFTQSHPRGTYVLALDGHAVCVEDGDYYDTWDSGDEMLLYYLKRRNNA